MERYFYVDLYAKGPEVKMGNRSGDAFQTSAREKFGNYFVTAQEADIAAEALTEVFNLMKKVDVKKTINGILEDLK